MQSQQCPSCGAVCAIPDQLAGRWITCECGTGFAADPLPDAPPIYDGDDLHDSPRRSAAPIAMVVVGLVAVGLIGIGILAMASNREPQLAHGDPPPRPLPRPLPHEPIPEEPTPPRGHIESKPKAPPEPGPVGQDGPHLPDPDKQPPQQPVRSAPEKQVPSEKSAPSDPNTVQFGRPLLVTAILTESELFARDGDRSLWLQEVPTNQVGNGQTVTFDGRFQRVGTKNYSRVNGQEWVIEIYRAIGTIATTLVKAAPKPDPVPPPSRRPPGKLRPVPPPQEAPLPLPEATTLDVVDVLIAFAKAENESSRRQSAIAALTRAKGLCECALYTCRDAAQASTISTKLTAITDILDSFTGADRADDKERRKLFRSFMSAVRSAEALAQSGDEVTAAGFVTRARRLYSRLKKKFPDSRETEEAEAILNP